MASKRPLLPQRGRLGLPGLQPRPRSTGNLPVCLFCSISRPARISPRNRPTPLQVRRFESTTTISNPRLELEQTLTKLETHFPTFINPSRLQLALQGLRQVPGQEAVRVAVLGLGRGEAGTTAKALIETILADPLQDEQEWERKLQEHNALNPLIIRIGREPKTDNAAKLSSSNALTEIHVSSPDYNSLDLELLLMETDLTEPSHGAPIATTEEDLLVPSVDIPSGNGHVTPLTAPVHQAVLVADGFVGATKLSALSLAGNEGSLMAAVNMAGISKDQLGVDFEVIDISKAKNAVNLFRQGPQHAMEYERQWFASNVPSIVSWIKAGAKSADQETKPAVRRLIASVLQSTLSTIQNEEARSTSRAMSAAGSTSLVQDMNKGLAEWSQAAHAELQDQLDVAFTGKRWRKLGWWKLYWRVDDVAMLTNEMLSQRFLPTAERELVYLAGRIAQSGVAQTQYPQPVSELSQPSQNTEKKRLGSGELEDMVPVISSAGLPKWPGHITFTRRYLQDETIPALQALAQKLVIQSLSLSSMTTSLAAMLYVSSVTPTLYEAGAVAALGVVYSLNRLQKKWEAARSFWEGEVREEGRKAVRATEQSVGEVLDGGRRRSSSEEENQLQKARELIAEAEDALARMK
ncbi:hypothetical protein B0I35DRAFT_478818 [Stachybotrys elegans]|uniref:Mmc1 C-terminal domain-containing protein n=1 Tax=Stachybotrys elegans TaxID=80388 RepID=A0A8K0SNS4_9HYPO|nr:hypothetical protein B0I35DRAFT_478818 [Stachybotrys elegans]